MDQLPKCEANYAPLTPVNFLHRAGSVYAERTSIIYENTRFTWRQTHLRCLRFASSLRSLLHISKNDVVSAVAPNVPALYEMHFAVPMAGAVLNAINTRLDANNIATILMHSEAKAVVVDYQLLDVVRKALSLMAADSGEREGSERRLLPQLVLIDDAFGVASRDQNNVELLRYEDLILAGDPNFIPPPVDDEWDAIALNYTSGTTSAPKGVVYSHRGAYLSTMGVLLQWGVGNGLVYLWSLPMFHCNGWTFTWGVAARGGVNVCLRATTAATMYRAIAEHSVTHMCCAPVILTMLLEAAPAERRPVNKTVNVLAGGAPPPAALLERMQKLGFHISHAYGLTEATATALVCEWHDSWNKLPAADQARLKARQGISALSLANVDVKDTETMVSVPRDGKTMGEIVLRGSSIMKGYYKNPEANAKAFKDGWFFTGDVGVLHPDGYIEIKDRAKDVIISGGENISSVEVESVLFRHPAVVEAAVVAMPHPRWGETPCAFVVQKKGSENKGVSEKEIIEYCRENMPHFTVPKKIVFLEELPKIHVKVQKFQLREMARKLATMTSRL